MKNYLLLDFLFETKLFLGKKEKRKRKRKSWKSLNLNQICILETLGERRARVCASIGKSAKSGKSRRIHFRKKGFNNRRKTRKIVGKKGKIAEKKHEFWRRQKEKCFIMLSFIFRKKTAFLMRQVNVNKKTKTS